MLTPDITSERVGQRNNNKNWFSTIDINYCSTFKRNFVSFRNYPELQSRRLSGEYRWMLNIILFPLNSKLFSLSSLELTFFCRNLLSRPFRFLRRTIHTTSNGCRLCSSQVSSKLTSWSGKNVLHNLCRFGALSKNYFQQVSISILSPMEFFLLASYPMWLTGGEGERSLIYWNCFLTFENFYRCFFSNFFFSFFIRERVLCVKSNSIKKCFPPNWNSELRMKFQFGSRLEPKRRENKMKFDRYQRRKLKVENSKFLRFFLEMFEQMFQEANKRKWFFRSGSSEECETRDNCKTLTLEK